MIAATSSFAAMTLLVRYVSAEVHPFEIAFFRNVFGLMIMLPFIWRIGGLAALRTQRFGLYSLRAVLNVASVLCWFWAVTLMPLADLTALAFTAPLWTTVFAALLIGEVVGARRWIATLVGFVGALVIVRPGFAEISLGVPVVLVAAAAWALTVICVRILTRTERAEAILTWQVLMMAPLSLVPALLVWQWPSPTALGWLALLAVFGTFGHICQIRAFALQEVSALQPLDFIKLPIIAAFAWILFDELPDEWMWLGAVIVFGAGTYISLREANLKRRGAIAADPGTPPLDRAA